MRFGRSRSKLPLGALGRRSDSGRITGNPFPMPFSGWGSIGDDSLGTTCLGQGTLHSHCLAMGSMIQMNWCCWDYARSRLLRSERLPVSAPMCRACKGALGDGV